MTKSKIKEKVLQNTLFYNLLENSTYSTNFVTVKSRSFLSEKLQNFVLDFRC